VTGQAGSPKRLSRRGFLILGGGIGVAGLAGAAGVAAAGRDGGKRPTAATAGTAHQHGATPSTAGRVTVAGARRWSDPGAWPQGVPGPESIAVVSRRIVLDRDASVAGVIIEPGGELVFEPTASRTLRSTGNVVIQGRLVMHPASAAVDQLIVFQGVDETRFVGGGMDVKATDVGLWVMGAGVLDLHGSGRRAWSRAAGAVAAGATSLLLQDEPVGWRQGDEVVLTPTLEPGDGSVTAYDSAKVRAVSGRTVTLDRPTRFAHPSVEVGTGRAQTAEVLNLTRNVRVEGAGGRRAHVFIRSSRSQSLVNVSIRHMGPRQPAEQFTEGMVGRYGLHFHMAGDGSRGSMVDGVVIRDCGGHAFVPHLSNGIVFRDCISHNTFDDAYWWDGAPDTRTAGPPSQDIRYERCVASMVRFDPEFRGFRLSGFTLGRGQGNVVRECVAVGVQGNQDAAGYQWPEGSEGVWTFEGCVAHNNAGHGIFAWQNTGKVHVITRFTAYHNGGAGISHGAYNNPYVYRDSTLHGNGAGAVILHANSGFGSSPLLFENLVCRGAGRSDYLVVADRHNGSLGAQPVQFAGCSFSGAGKAAFGWTYEGDNGPSTGELVDVVGCRFDGNEFWLASGIAADSRIRVQDRSHGSIVLRRADQQGEFRPQWNARVQQLPGGVQG
jgi:hypothetical protein